MKKTIHQLRTIQMSREVDEINGVKANKKTSKYKDPNYQLEYYWKNKEKRNQNSRKYYSKIKQQKQENIEKLKQYNKQYYLLNKEKLQQKKKDNYIRRKYGLPRM